MISEKNTKKRQQNNAKPTSSIEVTQRNVIRHRKETEYIGNYCKNTYKKYKAWRASLSQEEQEEHQDGLLIQNPKEVFKTFNSIDLYDVIGCITHSKTYNPKSYLVIGKNKEEQTLKVIPWQRNWLDLENASVKIKEIIHQDASKTRGILKEDEIKIEDISLSISLQTFIKLYRIDKQTNTFGVTSNEAKKVRIVTFVKQATESSLIVG